MFPSDFEVTHSSNEWKGGTPHVWLMFLFYTEKIFTRREEQSSFWGDGKKEAYEGAVFVFFQASLNL